MSRKSAIVLVVLLAAGGGYYYYHTQLSSSFLSRKKITIGGEEYDVRSKESLEEHGLQFRRVRNKDNAAIFYCKASNLYHEPEPAVRDVMHGVLSGTWATDPGFTRWFDKNRECLALLHKAVRKPDCQFPIIGKDSDLIFVPPPPYHPSMRAFARLLVCEGRHYEHQGESSRALDSYLCVATLAHHLSMSDRNLMGALVALACHEAGTKAVERWLANSNASVDDLRKAAARCEQSVANRPKMTDWLEAERARSRWMLEHAARDPDTAAEAHSLGMSFITPEKETARAWRIFRKTIGRHDEIWTRLWDDLEKWCALPTSQALQPGRSWEAYARRSPEQGAYNFLFLGAFDTARQVHARTEAKTGGTTIFAAIKLYEKKNGRPPSTLSELVPGCISKLPKDPFSGRDYVYKVRGSDYILYSVWDNLTDDGGAGQMPHSSKSDKDWVYWSKPIPIEPPPR